MAIVVRIATYMVDRSKDVFRNVKRPQRRPTLYLESALILGKARLSLPKPPQLQSSCYGLSSRDRSLHVLLQNELPPRRLVLGMSCCCPRMSLSVVRILMSTIFR